MVLTLFQNCTDWVKKIIFQRKNLSLRFIYTILDCIISMKTILNPVSKIQDTDNVLVISDRNQWDWAKKFLSKSELAYVQAAAARGAHHISLPIEGRLVVVDFLPAKNDPNAQLEVIRKAAAKRVLGLRELKVEKFAVLSGVNTAQTYAYLEGLVLGNYQYLQLFGITTKKDKSCIQSIDIPKTTLSEEVLAQLDTVLDAVCTARDWVNAPLSHFNSVTLANAIKTLMQDLPVSVEILDKAAIEALGMGGLLSVNKASKIPPTFTIAEYKPANAKNSKPIVLVGKGLVFDSGGLSIKPTKDSMDHMKCDMGGGAVVACTLYAAAKNKLPLHIISLVPSTDNLIDANAYVNGDVITISNGATVEILNTDAEGRLILADALHYAKRFNPELVIDFATLTGAAAAAIGQVGCVMMGTASEEVKAKAKTSGYATHERSVEFPLWDEYGDMIRSEIADIKNTGSNLAGACTAGKFLEFFTDYPWMHFDIAAPAFFAKEDGYLVKGGSGWGIRFMYDFLKNY
jgi:leucyl aminopeptidase